jgi:hypothetical protein
MSEFEIPKHIIFKEPGSDDAPRFNVPILPNAVRQIPDAWQILLRDTDDGFLWLTKWREGGRMDGTMVAEEATQFDIETGVLTALHKAAELRETQFNPDQLYIVNADRTSIAHITPTPEV